MWALNSKDLQGEIRNGVKDFLGCIGTTVAKGDAGNIVVINGGNAGGRI